MFAELSFAQPAIEDLQASLPVIDSESQEFQVVELQGEVRLKGSAIRYRFVHTVDEHGSHRLELIDPHSGFTWMIVADGRACLYHALEGRWWIIESAYAALEMRLIDREIIFNCGLQQHAPLFVLDLSTFADHPASEWSVQSDTQVPDEFQLIQVTDTGSRMVTGFTSGPPIDVAWARMLDADGSGIMLDQIRYNQGIDVIQPWAFERLEEAGAALRHIRAPAEGEPAARAWMQPVITAVYLNTYVFGGLADHPGHVETRRELESQIGQALPWDLLAEQTQQNHTFMLLAQSE